MRDKSPCASRKSGPADELRALLKELAAAGTFVRELDTGSVAYHSPMLQPVVAELRAGELCDRRSRRALLQDACAHDQGRMDATAVHMQAASWYCLFMLCVRAPGTCKGLL